MRHACALRLCDEKQLFQRLPREVIENTIASFNNRELSREQACTRLGISRSRLYALRTRWLTNGRSLPPSTSGGDHTVPWPDQVNEFLRRCLRTGEAPNFAFLSDELTTRFGFKRCASSVRAHIRSHMPDLLTNPGRRGPKPRRRWQRKNYGDLIQHDSSPHRWWEDAEEPLQILALSIDDATREIVAARFLPAETTFAHFAHVRSILQSRGLPAEFYTDGLSLFGHESRCAGSTDTLSQFQRALGNLGVSHLVAVDAPAKGKIERQFGYWQKRLPTLMRVEGVRSIAEANSLLAEQVERYNRNHVSRSTGMTPTQAVEKCLEAGHNSWRPAPPESLLDLHLSIHHRRVVQKASQISFRGRQWDIAHSACREVTVVEHPGWFAVISQAPTPQHPQWPTILAKYQI